MNIQIFQFFFHFPQNSQNPATKFTHVTVPDCLWQICDKCVTVTRDMLHHCLSLAWLIMGLGGTYPYPINLPDGPENLARITKITKSASYSKISSRKNQFSIFEIFV